MSARVLIAGIGGVGGALARRLARKGVSVHLVARSGDKLAALRAELGGGGAHAFTIADAAHPEAFEAAVREAVGAAPLAALVYAIGSIPLKPLKATSAADFSAAFDANFTSGALALRAAAGALAGGGAGGAPGAAVFFSTVAARVGFPNHAAIAAAKGAVEGWSRAAAAELAPRVRVNVIAPSLTDTPLAARFTGTEAVKKALGDAHPIPRLGSADEVAALAEFLIDDATAGWITGQVFSVDGGRSTLRPKN
jgi:NAD(P)-dependent dehydrogenase (short-subunit alcohol dehydrogenase family)